jgi:hypothetical protein
LELLHFSAWQLLLVVNLGSLDLVALLLGQLHQLVAFSRLEVVVVVAAHQPPNISLEEKTTGLGGDLVELSTVLTR